MGQSLTMTPQLQQAIKLLQLSSLDLEAEILDAIESNPLLEIQENQTGTETVNQDKSENVDSNATASDSNSNLSASNESPQEKDASDAIKSDTIENDMIGDTQWEDWGYTNQTSSSRADDNNQIEYKNRQSGEKQGCSSLQAS